MGIFFIQNNHTDTVSCGFSNLQACNLGLKGFIKDLLLGGHFSLRHCSSNKIMEYDVDLIDS